MKLQIIQLKNDKYAIKKINPWFMGDGWFMWFEDSGKPSFTCELEFLRHPIPPYRFVCYYDNLDDAKNIVNKILDGQRKGNKVILETTGEKL
jgi:hypothetical protein